MYNTGRASNICELRCGYIGRAPRGVAGRREHGALLRPVQEWQPNRRHKPSRHLRQLRLVVGAAEEAAVGVCGRLHEAPAAEHIVDIERVGLERDDVRVAANGERPLAVGQLHHGRGRARDDGQRFLQWPPLVEVQRLDALEQPVAVAHGIPHQLALVEHGQTAVCVGRNAHAVQHAVLLGVGDGGGRVDRARGEVGPAAVLAPLHRLVDQLLAAVAVRRDHLRDRDERVAHHVPQRLQHAVARPDVHVRHARLGCQNARHPRLSDNLGERQLAGVRAAVVAQRNLAHADALGNRNDVPLDAARQRGRRDGVVARVHVRGHALLVQPPCLLHEVGDGAAVPVGAHHPDSCGDAAADELAHLGLARA
eukprot:m.1275472 g.1275472  ORF g.1275472 m.1275472 type:complete len:366 (-) comp24761_c0_seq6:6128-7225(-)